MTKPPPSQGERGSDVAKLIERLKLATGPDRKLDAEIKLAHAAFLIAEGKTAAEVKSACGGDLYDDPLPYTKFIDVAVTVVPEGYAWECGCDIDLAPFARVWGRDFDSTEVAAHPAIALALTALKARQATGERE